MKQIIKRLDDIEKRLDRLEGRDESSGGWHTVAPISRHKGMNAKQLKEFLDSIV